MSSGIALPQLGSSYRQRLNVASSNVYNDISIVRSSVGTPEPSYSALWSLPRIVPDDVKSASHAQIAFLNAFEKLRVRKTRCEALLDAQSPIDKLSLSRLGVLG